MKHCQNRFQHSGKIKFGAGLAAKVKKLILNNAYNMVGLNAVAIQ